MMFVLCSIVVIHVTTNRTAVADDRDLEARLQQLEATAREAEAARAAGAPVLQAANDHAKKLVTQVVQAKLKLAKAESTLKDRDARLPKLQEAAKKADDDLQAARTAADAAKVTAAETAANDAKRTLTDFEKVVAEAQQTVTESPERIKAFEAAVAQFQPELAQAEATYQTLRQRAVAEQAAYEAVLFAAGRGISFSQRVAPILHERCVACHNTRIAKGRLNLDGYAALLKGGESGAVLVPGQLEASPLWTQVADGSMPKDAAPLTAEQQQTLRDWIAFGGKLDAGVPPTANLISIMPKPQQPLPPEVYPVAVPVVALAFSPDGALLASSGYREVLLWNVADGQLVRRVSNLAERPHDIRFSPDGQLLAVAAGTPGQLGEVKVFRVADGALEGDLLTVDDEVFAVAFSPDGSKLAAVASDRALRVFDWATRKKLYQVEDHADWILDVAWSADGTKLATASRDKTAKVFDAATGESLATFNPHQQPVYGIAFLADGATVVSCGRDNRLRAWTIADNKQVREIAASGELFRVRVSDGVLYAASSEKAVRSFQADNGQALKTFGPHTDWVHTLAVHGATKRLATGTQDGEIRLWDLESGKELLRFYGSPGYQKRTAP